MTANLFEQTLAVGRRSVVRTSRQRALLIFPMIFPLILFAINGSALSPATRIPGFPTHNYRDFLIAMPFIGEGGWPSEDLRPTRQMAVELHDRAPLYFYQGRDDETVPVSHSEMFAAAFPHAIIRRLEGRDHQLNDDLSELGHDLRLLT